MIDYRILEPLLPSGVYEEFSELQDMFGIDSVLRISHFLAQCAHESANFTVVEENLNYSKDALLRVFPKYFNEETAEEYARNPRIIASRVYANRMGNGPEDTEEGWLYRGRGYIQLTGKDNYRAFNKIAPDDITERPELVASKYPLLSAGWFWSRNRLNAVADLGASENTVAAVTKIVNGGFHGLENRVKLFSKFYSTLTT